ncbi:MAG: tRNA (adenosine(37)-N6)-threonylcarbamoyltransferase complex dimerization subunit type 1 TsaB [Firmicutes bacterium]|nr:tRNA (adenosine(37)-N6)-threonylcarbamoyltransferase complex dimerization subunit type 1 TsaB [Bacillota bacterium]
MRILGIDSSTTVAGVAVVEDDRLVVETFLNTRKNHSQRLMPMLDAMLREADLTLADIDALAVSIGPGSFTGLRIGLATVKGLAQATGKPLIGVPTLDALALNVAGLTGLICPVLDARKNEVYMAVYQSASSLQVNRISDYLAISPTELIGLFQGSRFFGDGASDWRHCPVTFLGDATPVYRDLLTEGLGNRARWVLPTHNLIRAAQIAYLGGQRLAAGQKDDYLTIKPLYIRQSEAEVRWQSREKENACYRR